MAGPGEEMAEEFMPGGSAPGDEETDAKTIAAQDFIDAQSSGNAAGVAAAFKRMYDICAEEHGSYTEEE